MGRLRFVHAFSRQTDDLSHGFISCAFDFPPMAMRLREARQYIAIMLSCFCHGRYVVGMTLAEIDQWIGKTLFIPPIIKLCQVTHQSQFAMSRLFWFAATCDGFYRAETLVQSILFGVLCFAAMLTAALRADYPAHSTMPFRYLALGLFTLDVVKGFEKADLAGAEFWILILFAEYAATIRTIPPSESKKLSTTLQGSAPKIR